VRSLGLKLEIAKASSESDLGSALAAILQEARPRFKTIQILAQGRDRLDGGQCLSEGPHKERFDDVSLFAQPSVPAVPGKEVAECYRHATEARERANHVNDPVLKQHFVDRERRWLSRVHADELIERLTEITD
jgi:hypothetical protein